MGQKIHGYFLKGNLDVDLVKKYVALPFPINGVTFLDMTNQGKDVNIFVERRYGDGRYFVHHSKVHEKR